MSRRAAREAGQQRAGERPLVVAVVAEVLLAQQLLVAVGGRHRRVAELHRLRVGLGRDAEPRQHRALDPPELLERVARIVLHREHGGERLGEQPEIRAGRAQRRAQGEERLGARGRVDGRQRPVRREQLPHPDRAAAGAHQPGELREAGGDRHLRHAGAVRDLRHAGAARDLRHAGAARDLRHAGAVRDLRHRRALPAPARARCPRAPSARRRACPPGRRPHRAPAAPAPT
jgi:hypothetical protein